MTYARASLPALVVSDLSVAFETSERVVQAVRHVSFSADRGETLAIVGDFDPAAAKRESATTFNS